MGSVGVDGHSQIFRRKACRPGQFGTGRKAGRLALQRRDQALGFVGSQFTFTQHFQNRTAVIAHGSIS